MLKRLQHYPENLKLGCHQDCAARFCRHRTSFSMSTMAERCATLPHRTSTPICARTVASRLRRRISGLGMEQYRRPWHCGRPRLSTARRRRSKTSAMRLRRSQKDLEILPRSVADATFIRRSLPAIRRALYLRSSATTSIVSCLTTATCSTVHLRSAHNPRLGGGRSDDDET